MNQFRKFLYLTGIIVLASCGSYKQTDNLGFGGGRCNNVQTIHKHYRKNTNHERVNAVYQVQARKDTIQLQAIARIANSELKQETFEDSFILSSSKNTAKNNLKGVASRKKRLKLILSNLVNVSNKQFYKSILLNKKSDLGLQEIQKIQRRTNENSGVSALPIISFIIGIIGMVASIILLVVGGNSSNYYLIGMIGGLIFLVSYMLFVYGMYGMSYNSLGTLGKIGFWLTVLSPLTGGIGALIGIPLWIIGWIGEV